MQAKVEYTARCNLDCIHCSAALFRPAPDWETDALMDLLNQLIDDGYDEFHLQGGEPFIRSDLFDILDLFEQNNAIFALSTNSLLLDEEKIEKLLQYKGLLTFSFSLDGATAKTHNTLRGDNVFDYTLKMIQYAVKKKAEIAPQKNLNLNYTLTKMNCHELTDLLELANTMGLDSVTILSLSLLGNAADHEEELFLPEKEEFIILQKAATFLRKLNIRRKINGLHPLSINMDLFTFTWKCTLMKLSKHITGKEGGSICGTGTGTIYVALDGTIYPCEGTRVFMGMLEEILGPYERPNIKEYTIAQAKETESFKKIVTYLRDYEQLFSSITPCNTCGYLGNCTICPLFAMADGEVKRCTQEVLSTTI